MKHVGGMHAHGKSVEHIGKRRRFSGKHVVLHAGHGGRFGGGDTCHRTVSGRFAFGPVVRIGAGKMIVVGGESVARLQPRIRGQEHLGVDLHGDRGLRATNDGGAGRVMRCWCDTKIKGKVENRKK